MLDPAIKSLAQGPNLGTVSFLLPSGQIATHVTWVDADDDHIILNTEVHRAKFKAMQRDPRVTVTVSNHADPHRYAEVRGRVVSTERGPAARAHIDELSMQYHGIPYRHPIESERVIMRIAPDRQRLG